MKKQWTYLETHPWITFKLNLQNLPILTWTQLGECASKCDFISGVPLRPATSRELYTIYLAKGIQATTAIEGNTLSEDDVKRIINNELKLPPSKEYLEQEVRNIEHACNEISEHIAENKYVEITPEVILKYNKIVLNNIKVDENVIPGEFRKHSVVVGRYLGPQADEVPHLINELCNWLNSDYFEKKGFNKNILAFIKAIIAHIHIVWIHPFGDGNGRTARLLEYKILAQSGIPLPTAHLLSNHYNITRIDYYRHLEKSSKANDGILNFITYAIQGLFDGLNDQLQLIKKQQINVALRNFIHEKFEGKKGDTWRRRRNLALDLSILNKPVKKDDIVLLSKRVNKEYASKSEKTLTRDINILLEMDLIKHIDNQISINENVILAFLPLRKQ